MFKLLRDVTIEGCGSSVPTVWKAGQTVYKHGGCHYGCLGENEVAITNLPYTSPNQCFIGVDWDNLREITPNNGNLIDGEIRELATVQSWEN